LISSNTPHPAFAVHVKGFDQLEWWNTGMLEKWGLEIWVDGLMVHRKPNHFEVKNRPYPCQTQYSTIPLFHE
jgi:hypothetical protein